MWDGIEGFSKIH